MLKDIYKKEIVPKLIEELKLKNLYEVPAIKKVVVSMGVGKQKEDKKFLQSARKELAQITGQGPNTRRARKAISGFKLRAGEEIGLSVTLRGQRKWDFFEKLVRVVLPRVRDFRGLKRSAFDGKGNYTLGIKEHIVFPEIDPNKTDRIKSLEISVVTTARNDEVGFLLLDKLGMPFKKE